MFNGSNKKKFQKPLSAHKYFKFIFGRLSKNYILSLGKGQLLKSQLLKKMVDFKIVIG